MFQGLSHQPPSQTGALLGSHQQVVLFALPRQRHPGVACRPGALWSEKEPSLFDSHLEGPCRGSGGSRVLVPTDYEVHPEVCADTAPGLQFQNIV